MVIKVLYFVLLVLIASFVLYWTHEVYDKVWVKGYLPVDYLQSSQVNRDPWRWREPRSNLRIPYNVADRPGIRDTPNVSSFVFRSEFRFADFLSPLLGLALIGFDLLLIFKSTVSTANFLLAFVIYFCLFYLGWFFLQYGDRVQRIDLYPDRVEIIARFTNFIPRTIIYERRQLLSIYGKLQSFWTMERGQTQPDYKLIIMRPLLSYFQVNQTLRLRCDPTQGAWIVGGLNHWKSLSSRHSQLS